MITTVLIDVDDTLLDFDLCAEWSMNRVAQTLNLQLPEKAFEVFKRINSGLWKQVEKKEITTDQLFGRRWSLVAKEWKVTLDGEEFEALFLNYLSESIIPVEDAKEMLAYLKSKYRVFVASNGPYGQQLQRMKLSGMEQYMDGYFISEKIGHSKPSFEFFDYCFKTVEAKLPEEIIMIGDSLSADINGAIAYGMKTCWFNKGNVSVETKSDYVIKKLKELQTVL